MFNEQLFNDLDLPPPILSDPKHYDFSEVSHLSPKPPHGDDKFVTRMLTRGFSTKINPSLQGKVPHNIIYQPPPEYLTAYTNLINGLKSAGILEQPSVPRRKCILNEHFVNVKQSGVLRLIFNGKRVNRCLPLPPHFNSDNITSISKDIATYNYSHASELDFRHGYYQIRVAPRFRHFLCIWTPTHGVLQFTRLPMGMCWAAFCLHKAVSSTVRSSPHPHSTAIYADNIYPFGTTYSNTTARLNDIVHPSVLNLC
jgi:hypothetical protein